MAAAQRSRALPWAWHLKQWKQWSERLAAEGTAARPGRAVQRTGAALLGAACGGGRELQEGEDLGQGDDSLDGGEVDGRTRRFGRLGTFGLSLPDEFTAFAGLGQLAIAGLENRLSPAIEHVLGSDVADGAVQANGVVAFDIIGDHAAGIFQRQRRLAADAIALEGTMEAFDLAIALGIVRRGLDVGHAADADELLEVLGDELGAVVGDDAWSDARVTLRGLVG